MRVVLSGTEKSGKSYIETRTKVNNVKRLRIIKSWIKRFRIKNKKS